MKQADIENLEVGSKVSSGPITGTIETIFESNDLSPVKTFLINWNHGTTSHIYINDMHRLSKVN